MSIVFLFKARDGKVDFESEHTGARFRDALKRYNGKEFRIELLLKTRSMNQNRFYWAYLELIEKETGNLAHDLHEYFRRLLLPPKCLVVMSKSITVPSSTTELSKHAMSDYMDKIAALTNVPIPNPEVYKKYLDSAPTL